MEILNNLITIKQLPEVTENLKSISVKAKENVDKALSLVPTEENKTAIKSLRTELKKDFNALEDARKAVDREIKDKLKPFTDSYKKYITDIYKPADEELKRRIDEIERFQLEDKLKPILEYFGSVNKIEWLTFEMLDIRFTLSTSDNSIKRSIDSKLDSIETNLNTIDTLDDKDEVLYWYKKHLNISEAIGIVAEKKKALTNANVEVPVESNGPLQPPVVEDEEEYEMTFTVKASKTKLKELKNFLEERGIKYE